MCNLWTSSNHLTLLDVNAHFTIKTKLLKVVTLGLKQIQGAHSGENQAEIIWTLLIEYRIINKAGYFVIDNVTNNNTMIQDLAIQSAEQGISFDPVR